MDESHEGQKRAEERRRGERGTERYRREWREPRGERDEEEEEKRRKRRRRGRTGAELGVRTTGIVSEWVCEGGYVWIQE